MPDRASSTLPLTTCTAPRAQVHALMSVLVTPFAVVHTAAPVFAMLTADARTAPLSMEVTLGAIAAVTVSILFTRDMMSAMASSAFLMAFCTRSS